MLFAILVALPLPPVNGSLTGWAEFQTSVAESFYSVKEDLKDFVNTPYPSMNEYMLDSDLTGGVAPWSHQCHRGQ